MAARRFAAIVIPGLLFAGAATFALTAPPEDKPLPDTANRTCPVLTSRKVDPAMFSDYRGVRVYFCCAKCKAAFEKDPSAYIANIPALAKAADAPLGTQAGPERGVPGLGDTNGEEATGHALGGRRPGSAIDNASIPSDAIQRALFATDSQQLFDIRRAARVAMLPPAPPIPVVPQANAAMTDLDAFIIDSWAKADLPEYAHLPPLCDDATFARRVYLDVIGVIPTIDELQRFLNDPAPNKRARLIDELLGESRSADYADHWTAFWEDALASSTVGVNAGMATHGNYSEWINSSFKTNKPFDLFAAELLDPTLPGHKPVVYGSDNGRPVRINFVLNESHTDTLQTAAAVAQVFMGTAMKCASCHNHFENKEWPQKRFLAFAGLFGTHDLEVIRCEHKTGDIVTAAFPFDIPGAPTDMPASENGRLTRVAQLLVDPLNPRFAKSIGNRLWKRYLGLGLFEPADDYREGVTPSPPGHPELLDWLALDFMRHDYDLKHTIRLILNSRTYQQRYDPALEDHFDSGNPGKPRYFRSPTLRRLTAEQALDSIDVAIRQRLDPQSRTFRRINSTGLTRSLGKPAIRNDISTGRSDEPAILQGLELLNGEEFGSLARGGKLVSLALNAQQAENAAEVLFHAVRSRDPLADERSLVTSYLQEHWTAKPPNPAIAKPAEFVWLEDDLPAGSITSGAWQWVDANEQAPASGARSHTQGDGDKMAQRSQHFVMHLPPSQPIGPADTLFCYVWLDPKNPPHEIMLQWNDGGGMDGGWAHRAYWGEDIIPFGENATASRRHVGPLPKAGEWLRLEVSGSDVGFDSGASSDSVIGISFDQAGGRVLWDKAGAMQSPPSPAAEDVHDILWTLFASPEFQYIH